MFEEVYYVEESSSFDEKNKVLDAFYSLAEAEEFINLRIKVLEKREFLSYTFLSIKKVWTNRV